MKAGIVTSISFGCAIILALATGTGCSRDSNLYGTWEGLRDWKTLRLDNEEVARGLSGIELKLRGGGDFELRDGGTPFEGSWSQSGNTIELHVTTILNRPLEQQQPSVQKSADFMIRYEGGKMFFKNPVDPAEIELKKKSKP